jgi:hypothetical protein
VLAAVRGARAGAADVRVVPFATLSAIWAELDRGPAHVLHVTRHGSPGALALEDDDGSARKVSHRPRTATERSAAYGPSVGWNWVARSGRPR